MNPLRTTSSAGYRRQALEVSCSLEYNNVSFLSNCNCSKVKRCTELHIGTSFMFSVTYSTECSAVPTGSIRESGDRFAVRLVVESPLFFLTNFLRNHPHIWRYMRLRRLRYIGAHRERCKTGPNYSINSLKTITQVVKSRWMRQERHVACTGEIEVHTKF